MRNSLKLLAPISLLTLAACSEATDSSSTTDEMSAPAAEEAGVNAAAASRAGAAPADTLVSEIPGAGDIPVTLPKMAYLFDYGFRLAGEAIAPLQQQHADMCEAQGPYACRIISLSRTGEEADEIHGELQLAVASDKARGFGALLSAAAESADAEAFRANIQGEDLSKSIVDTEARLRSRIALRDRLMQVLETRKGKVEELVEAERQVAAVNEEIDQARSWLKEQQGRVAFSRMTLTYESAAPGGSFFKPVKGALGSLGSIFGTIFAFLIVIGAIVGPLVLAVLGIRYMGRRMNRGVSAAEA
jgi:hypothetical protein